MAKVSSSACRNRRGEPQAITVAHITAAIAAEARHILCPSIRSNVGWLRRIALPGVLHQNITRRDGFIRIDSPFAGESEQQGLVADHVIKHAGEKARLLRRGPNSIDSKAGHIEKSRNSRRVAGEQFECGNRQLISACALGALALYCSAMPAHVLSRGKCPCQNRAAIQCIRSNYG